ncbi:hypothetical protein [Pseudomonas putida]|uniref:hypothetical protein n=1 Tax=Pseudomonas putida TaxID=303 RepID=UPI002366EB5F|nr:hypothetical protein [Pseudomonas putida]MDD2049359.1 hypothetical protein [Pseudomonas putida]
MLLKIAGAFGPSAWKPHEMPTKIARRGITRSTIFKYSLVATLLFSAISIQQVSAAAIASAKPVLSEHAPATQIKDPSHTGASASATRPANLSIPSRTHEALLKGTPQEAKAWINNLSTMELEFYLDALSPDTLEKIGISPVFRKGSETGIQLQQLNSMTEANKQKYIEFIESSINEQTKKFVLDLKPGAAELLLEFAHEKGIQEQDPSKLNTDIVRQWRSALDKELKELSDKFPLHDESRPELRKTILQMTSDHSLLSNAHENEYAKNALYDYLKTSHLSKYGIENWEFRAKHYEALWEVLHRLDDPIPGGEPELVFFLDSALARSSIVNMSAAWAERGHLEPRLLSHEDINRFLSEFSGKTLILVGHIENRQFVQDRGAGREPLKMDIPVLVEKAQQRGVFLVPIGCNSAKEGAFFGFTRPILSDEVAELLKAIPAGSLSLGALLSAFNKIGSISIDSDNFNQYLEVTVRKSVSGSDRNDEAAITVTRYPSTLHGSNIPFSAYQISWESANRPISDSGGIGAWRASYRSGPIGTLFGTGLTLVFCVAGWIYIRKNIIRRRTLISRSETWALRGVVAIAFIFFAGALIHIFWTLGWMTWAFVAAFLLVLILEPDKKEHT